MAIEIVPGDSLGTAFAALMCGVRHVHALGVVAHASSEGNVALLDRRISLVRARRAA